jgi:hypothetical protein
VSFLAGFFVIPIAYLVIVVTLLAKRTARGVGVSLIFFALAAGSAYWAITQSRSSTAAIGIIGLPFIGALGGFLGLAFGRWRSSTEHTHSLGAFAGLAGAVLLVAFNIREGTKTVAKNEVRDEQQAAHSEEIARDRALIAAALGRNEDRQRSWLDSSIRTRTKDRAFLIAALENDSISPDILDSLANSNDFGIALQAVRNPSTGRATLRRVYLTHTYPDYFFQALAGHPNTPPEIIRELYTKPRTITGLDGWFARNAATPRDVLEKLATSTTSTWAISQLVQNPVLDCALLDKAARNLSAAPSDSASQVAAQLEEVRPTVCPNGPSR